MQRFWEWVKNEDTNERTLYLNGIIAHNGTWFEDDVTPAAFKEELNGDGINTPVTVWIDSPGGDVFAAAEIYNALKEYKGKVTVKIGSIAASAASVIAMSGDKVLISPVGQMMVHNPSTWAIGDSEEMQKAVAMLDEVKEAIINAYELKTGQPREKLSNFMDAETWLSAYKAIELGFADGVLEDDKRAKPTNSADGETYAFSRRAVTNSLLDKIKPKTQKNEPPKGIPAESREKRLILIPHN
jgi:ATP-dependent Clp protease protease subunit